ncbi:MAG: DUF732 domain-containing protein [Acidimicrobiaceae bacterium]|nr:DUF732 domain-containing protein [Acidimicrobiaceae bacterium]MBO0748286.1 DUF732 domain-containing protein [Acidimicrobiaceae bacterium]
MAWSGSRGRREVVRLVATVTLGMLLLGCGAGRSAAAKQQDQRFVQSVESAAPDVSHYRNNTQLIRLGKAACVGFASGVSYQQLADRLILSEGSHPLPSEDLGAVITSAVNTYCPKYDDRVK